MGTGSRYRPLFDGPDKKIERERNRKGEKNRERKSPKHGDGVDYENRTLSTSSIEGVNVEEEEEVSVRLHPPSAACGFM